MPFKIDTRRLCKTILLLSIVLQCAFIYMHYKQSWFSTDDFMNFAIARQTPLSTIYLFKGIFGHFAPAHRFIDYQIVRGLRFSWPAAIAVVGLTLLVTNIATLYILVKICRRDPWLIFLILPASISALYTSSLAWFASGLHTFPALMCNMLCLAFLIRSQERRSSLNTVCYCIFLALGLCFYVKAIFIPIAAFSLLYLLHTGTIKDKILMVLRTNRFTWLASILILAAYFLILKLGYYRPGHQPVTAIRWLEWGQVVLLHGPFIGFWGLNPRARLAYFAIFWPVALALWLGILVYAVYKRKGGELWFFVTAVILGVLMTGYGRAGQYGPSVAEDFRYSLEMAPLGAVFLALLFRSKTLEEAAESKIKVLVPVVSIGAVLLSFCSSSQYLRDSYYPGAIKTRTYFDNLRRSMAAAKMRSLNIYDSYVPWDILNSMFDPYARVSYIAKLVDKHSSLTLPDADNNGDVINEFGNCVPAKKVDILNIGVSRCMLPTDVGPLNVSFAGQDLLYLEYSTEGNGDVGLTFGPSEQTITLASGSKKIIALGPLSFNKIDAQIPSTQCLKSLRIYRVTPK